jgi:hypothetical protein
MVRKGCDPMKRIDEIAARAEKATKGPWDVEYYELNGSDRKPILSHYGKNATNDLIFIEHAREDIPFLLASQKKMREALQAVVGLFRDSSFYIKKLGLPITNGDQERIDRAFILAEAALKGEGENV